ncbi:MAG TPA: hypothetical protein VMR52_08695 [Dehalococcoidia bacterium]|nr:hypothetical protein [Dehalococcoidia bacterium]
MLAIAIALTRLWTAFYTRGLPPDLRSRRREEIDCDLWEHRRLAQFQGSTSTAAEILQRLIFGLPADLVWRLEAGPVARSGRGTQMNDTLMMRGVLATALAVAAFPLVIGILVLIGLNGEMSDSERAIFGPIQILIGSVIIFGILVSASKRSLGLGLIIVGVAAISVMWYWAAFITVPIGLGLAAIAYWRARRSGWPRAPRPA